MGKFHHLQALASEFTTDWTGNDSAKQQTELSYWFLTDAVIKFSSDLWNLFVWQELHEQNNIPNHSDWGEREIQEFMCQFLSFHPIFELFCCWKCIKTFAKFAVSKQLAFYQKNGVCNDIILWTPIITRFGEVLKKSPPEPFMYIILSISEFLYLSHLRYPHLWKMERVLRSLKLASLLRTNSANLLKWSD